MKGVNKKRRKNTAQPRATPHKDNNKITVQSITKCGNQNGYTPQGYKVKRDSKTVRDKRKQKRQKKALSSDASVFLRQRQITFLQKMSILKTKNIRCIDFELVEQLCSNRIMGV